MDSNVLASLITGIASVLAVIITNAVSNRKVTNDITTHNAVVDTKLEQLTEKVNKHNNLIERMYRLEGKVERLEKEVEQHD